MSVKDLTTLGSSSQQPTRYRNHGAYVLRWNQEGFLFDPGEGTQRQFIFAGISPTCIQHIFVSHFHGDHCLGLGSMLMRLNLDKVKHPIHCYYPASGKAYFDRLRYCAAYHSQIQVIEHPVSEDGLVYENENFFIEAYSLDHGIDCLAWKVSEKPRRKFHKDKVKACGLYGPDMQELIAKGSICKDHKTIHIEDLSYMQKGDSFAYIADTALCDNAFRAAQNAKMLLCESTYLHEQEDMAKKHKHLTVTQAAEIAKQAQVSHQLILTHFSARYTDLNEFLAQARKIYPHTQVAEDLKRFAFPK